MWITDQDGWQAHCNLLHKNKFCDDSKWWPIANNDGNNEHSDLITSRAKQTLIVLIWLLKLALLIKGFVPEENIWLGANWCEEVEESSQKPGLDVAVGQD